VSAPFRIFLILSYLINRPVFCLHSLSHVSPHKQPSLFSCLVFQFSMNHRFPRAEKTDSKNLCKHSFDALSLSPQQEGSRFWSHRGYGNPPPGDDKNRYAAPLTFLSQDVEEFLARNLSFCRFVFEWPPGERQVLSEQ